MRPIPRPFRPRNHGQPAQERAESADPEGIPRVHSVKDRENFGGSTTVRIASWGPSSITSGSSSCMAATAATLPRVGGWDFTELESVWSTPPSRATRTDIR